MKNNTKILFIVIALLVAVVGILFFVVLQSPAITTKDEAEKSSQEVFKNIADIKTTLQEIKDNLKHP